MTSRTQKMDSFLDDLGPIVDGDRDAIARHADFLSEDDEARDLRHEASSVVAKLAHAGADYMPAADLEARLLAALDARTAREPAGEGSFERKTSPGFLVDPASPVVMTPAIAPVASIPATVAMPAVTLENAQSGVDPYGATQLGSVMPSSAPTPSTPVSQAGTSNVLAFDASKRADVVPQQRLRHR